MSMDEVETREIDRRERLNQPAARLDYRPVGERIRDFQEACSGFTPETARAEASRCIQCPSPRGGVLACPLRNDIPQALWEISQGNLLGAAAVFRQTSNFPELCGRLCPDEALCAGSCGVRRHTTPLQIGRLEAFVADHQRRVEGGLPLPPRPPATGKRVAIVGSGPAGLTAAEELALRGHEVTLLEAERQPGGALVYSIPRFRLPLEIMKAKIAQLRAMGVKFMVGTRFGQDVAVHDLFRDGFHALLLSSGAGRDLASEFLPGMGRHGVHLATDWLQQSNLDRSYLRLHLEPLLSLRPDQRVVVFGEGHAAVDCARTAIRLGARDVTCFHRGTQASALWRMEDCWAAQEEGVTFVPLVEPTAFLNRSNGHLLGIRYRHLHTGGRERDSHPIPIEGVEETMGADLVVLAPQRGPADLATAVPGLEVDGEGWAVVDPHTGRTSREHIFSAGDVTGQAHLAVMAIAEGRRVAASIHDDLT